MARDARAAAEKLRALKSKRTMLDIAIGYEKLAEWVATMEKLEDRTIGAEPMRRVVSDAARLGGRRRNSE